MGKHKYYITWKSVDAFNNKKEIVGYLSLTTKRRIKTHEDIEYIKASIIGEIKRENKIQVSNLIIINIIKL